MREKKKCKMCGGIIFNRRTHAIYCLNCYPIRYAKNNKKNLKKYFRTKMKIHKKTIDDKYWCNYNIKANKKFITDNWSKVTCKKCLNWTKK